MTTYIDVGAIRIQEYLLRTSGTDEGQLRKRRGASRMVAAAFDPDSFTDLGLARNDETYAIEGVAHLKARDDSASPEELARRALEQVRAALPAAYLQASWAVADSYVEAHPLLTQAREGRAASTDRATIGTQASLPAFREDPYAGSCTSCRQATVVGGQTCLDCRRRDETGGTNRRSGSDQPSKASDTPESVVLERISSSTGQRLQVAKDLNQLSRLPNDETKRNHLATIYADGNRVGALFAAVQDPAVAIGLSQAVEAAIEGAGEKALEALLPACRTGTLPGVVTVLAADDAVITVPASLGWSFALTLVRTFNALIADDERVARALDFGGQVPTLTAGIAFSHTKSPIESAIQAADRAMRDAKLGHPGEPAVGWVDLTHPGDEVEARCTVEWLDQTRLVVDGVAQLPASQRSGWERDIAAAQGAGLDDDAIIAFLRREIRRLGIEAVELDKLTVDDVQRLIGIARWWPINQEGNR